jgi:uncharacterized protein
MSVKCIGPRNLILAIMTILVLSCSDYSNPGKSSALGKLPTNEEKMLTSIGSNVIAKNVANFSVLAQLLNEDIEQYCSQQTATTLVAAQNQWVKTMLAYHFIDAAAFGPIQENQEDANIYSWPSLNTCGVDIEVANLALNGASGKNLTANRKGLGALEYLLFNTEFSSRCNLVGNPQVKIWQERTVSKKTADRCQFARVLAQDVATKAGALSSAWSPEQGDFTQKLVNGSGYSSAKAAITDLTTSLSSLEKLKEARLGAPVGLSPTCLSEEQKCPELIEHPWSHIGLQAIVAQLQGFRLIFLGGNRAEDFGYDDYMAYKGIGDVAQELQTHLEKAIAEAEALATNGSMQDQVAAMIPARCSATTETSNLEPLCGLYLEIQQVSILFRTNVLTMLSIENHVLTPGDSD